MGVLCRRLTQLRPVFARILKRVKKALEEHGFQRIVVAGIPRHDRQLDDRGFVILSIVIAWTLRIASFSISLVAWVHAHASPRAKKWGISFPADAPNPNRNPQDCAKRWQYSSLKLCKANSIRNTRCSPFDACFSGHLSLAGNSRKYQL